MTNTLVTHKKLKSLGIGCISKEFKNQYQINWGLEDSMKCKKDAVEVIDTSKCKTVAYQEFRSRILNDKSTLNRVIVGNELKEYVGIGWITVRAIFFDDLKRYPRVI